jgi:hypothetical protein
MNSKVSDTAIRQAANDAWSIVRTAIHKLRLALSASMTAEELVVSWLKDLGLSPIPWQGYSVTKNIPYTKWESNHWRICLYEDLTFVGYNIWHASYIVVKLADPTSTQVIETWIKDNNAKSR